MNRFQGNELHTPHFDLGPKPRLGSDAGPTGTGAAVGLLLSTVAVNDYSVDNIDLD